jgi:hypothetical protein
MESLSQAKVGSALQVFFNLEELQQAVASRSTKYLHDLERTVKAALDTRQLGAPTSVPAGSRPSGAPGGAWQVRAAPFPSPPPSTLFAPCPLPAPYPHPPHHAMPCTHSPMLSQEKLWSGLRDVADQLQAAMTAVWHLQRVVAKKKDPLTHVCFLDVLIQEGQPLLTRQFW